MGSNRGRLYKGMNPRDAVSHYERSIFQLRVEVDRCHEAVRIFGKIRPDDSRPRQELRAAEKDLRDSERFLAEALAAATSAPTRLPSTEQKKLPSRLRRYYSGMKREIAAFERDMAERGEDYYGRGRRRLENMAKSGATFPYPPRPGKGAPWIVAQAIIAVTEEREEGLDLLYRSFYYGAADFYCDAANYMGTSARFLAVNDFNGGALLLAEALTLGCWMDAERIAKVTRFALGERRRFEGQLICGFLEVDQTCVAPFILNLYAQWSGKPFPLEDLPLQSMQAYEPLLAVWQTEDLEALEEALLSACDFHMERSNLSETNSLNLTRPSKFCTRLRSWPCCVCVWQKV